MNQRCEWADHGCSRYSCLSRACGTYHVPVLSPGADISSSLHDVNIIPNNEIIVLKVIGIIPCLVPGHETYHLYGSDADKFFAQDSMPFEAAPGARVVPENTAADEPLVDTVTPDSVDDFKLAGPKDKLAEGWKLIKQGLTMEEPEILGVFLGCSHVRKEAKLADHSFMADSPVYKDSKTLNDAVHDRRRRQDALYGARFVLMGLLCVIGFLACAFTRWTSTCDKRLHRLVSYIDSTGNACQVGWVADPLSSLFPVLYVDADFTGCMNTQHSTIGLPAFDFWQKLLPHARKMRFLEANQTMRQCCQSGCNPTMKHLIRSHRVSVTWTHEQYKLCNFTFGHAVVLKEGVAKRILEKPALAAPTSPSGGIFSRALARGGSRSLHCGGMSEEMRGPRATPTGGTWSQGNGGYHPKFSCYLGSHPNGVPSETFSSILCFI